MAYDLGMDANVRLAMVTCVKNEARLMSAFVRYHMAVGVSKVYVYLDSCSDDTAQIAASFPSVDLIEIDPELSAMFPDMASKQRCITDDGLERARRDGFDWMLMIDPDEFAFADNEIENGSALERGDLLRMLAEVPEEYDVVRLQTVESVVCSLPDGKPFYANHFFQRQDRPLTYELRDPASGEVTLWKGFFGHEDGKTIVRTSADVQAFDQHRWVRNQGQTFPRSPANLPARVLDRGIHFHYWVSDKNHFVDKYKKLAWTPDTWPCGTQEGYPKRLFKRLSVTLSEAEFHQYLDDSIYLPEATLRERAERGELEVDPSVESILATCPQAPPMVPRDQPEIQWIRKSDVYRPAFADLPLLPDATLLAKDFIDPFWSGVMYLQVHEGRYFRWLSREAKFPIRALPGNYWLTVDMGPLHDWVDASSISIEWNGQAIESELTERFETSVKVPLLKTFMSTETELNEITIRSKVNEDVDMDGGEATAGMPFCSLKLLPLTESELNALEVRGARNHAPKSRNRLGEFVNQLLRR